LENLPGPPGRRRCATFRGGVPPQPDDLCEYGKYHRVVSRPVTEAEAERESFPDNLKDANEQKLREREALDRQLREGWGQS
jgi:hypothetical protein